MTVTNEPTAVAVLETGERFEGIAYGALGRTFGIAHIHPHATGYQEALTAPEQVGKVVVFSSPHVGVVGVNDDDARADEMGVAGLIVRDPARRHSNFRATRSLTDDVQAASVVGIAGVDTRAIVRIVSAASAPVTIGIFSGEDALLDPAEQLALVLEAGKNR